MATKRDPLAEALLGAEKPRIGQPARWEKLFGDRPEVTEAVIVLRRDRGFTWGAIVDIVNKNLPAGEVGFHKDTIRNWFKTTFGLE